jgi:single stranded DNA-binding protein
MPFVRVEQRNARLAGSVRLDHVNGRDGQVAKATMSVVSNARRAAGEEDEPTFITWTVWGRQAENAAEYLGKGSHVNVVGRMKNNNYQDGQGATVYGFDFVCDEIDYLDTKAESEARRARQDGAGQEERAGRPAAAEPQGASKRTNGGSRRQA